MPGKTAASLGEIQPAGAAEYCLVCSAMNQLIALPQPAAVLE